MCHCSHAQVAAEHTAHMVYGDVGINKPTCVARQSYKSIVYAIMYDAEYMMMITSNHLLGCVVTMPYF